jgi:hypothetical protein
LRPIRSQTCVSETLVIYGSGWYAQRAYAAGWRELPHAGSLRHARATSRTSNLLKAPNKCTDLYLTFVKLFDLLFIYLFIYFLKEVIVCLSHSIMKQELRSGS